MTATGGSPVTALGLAMTAWLLASIATAYVWLRRHVPPGAALAGAAFAALLP